MSAHPSLGGSAYPKWLREDVLAEFDEAFAAARGPCERTVRRWNVLRAVIGTVERKAATGGVAPRMSKADEVFIVIYLCKRFCSRLLA